MCHLLDNNYIILLFFVNTKTTLGFGQGKSLQGKGLFVEGVFPSAGWEKFWILDLRCIFPSFLVFHFSPFLSFLSFSLLFLPFFPLLNFSFFPQRSYPPPFTNIFAIYLPWVRYALFVSQQILGGAHHLFSVFPISGATYRNFLWLWCLLLVIFIGKTSWGRRTKRWG